ncbi:hypothetical protein [Microvirga lotononidis]|uniref:CRISPR associated protein Cas2 n=1 Tax=Microvirga lotononidis TaxID=864069 RepID=I4YMA7_9HYPH|nr:hypothetical protein [Microvirga lotononidis]EIM25099.1 hypothetical protein MicloDRAFT_00058190 [Microvirga lotononidis]WQO29410.1 SinR [Microvirga lotononidis]
MAQYLISYDLHWRRDYEPMWNFLTNQGGVRLLESLWLLSSTATIAQVSQVLTTLIDNDDSFALIELKQGSEWGTMRAKPEGAQWLQNNIRRY